MPKYTRCSHCKQLLPEDEFASNAHEASGRQHECRACRKRYYQEGFVARDKPDPETIQEIRCPRCGRVLPPSEFTRASDRPNGRQSMCKECKHEYDRQYYANNPQYRERVRQMSERRRDELRDYLYEYLSTHPCEMCGESRPACLCFHHRNPKDKDIELSIAVFHQYSQARLEAEIAKCTVLCQNCHAIVTAQEKGYRRSRR